MDRQEGIKKIIKECRNVGQKTAEYLYEARIYGISDLRKLGAKEAFFQMWRHNPTKVILHPCFLWALDGAIKQRSALQTTLAKKKEFKKYIEDFKKALR